MIQHDNTITFAKVIFDGDTYLVCPFDSLLGILPAHIEDGGTYVVEHVSMTQAEYDALPEFNG